MEEELTRQQQERDKLKEEIARKVEDQELKKNVKVKYDPPTPVPSQFIYIINEFRDLPQL